MAIENIFFPTDYLRTEYLKRVLSQERLPIDNNLVGISVEGVKIYFKNSLEQMPGFWAAMHLDGENGRKIREKAKEIIPSYWFEKYLYFPEEVNFQRFMEDKWRQKYNFTGEDINYKGWNIFFKEAQTHLEMGKAFVAYSALLFNYKNNPYFLKKYRRYYIFEDLAYCFEALGELPKAIRCLQIQASLQPESADPYLNMSSFLLLNGLYEEAIETCLLGLMIDEDNEYLTNNLLTGYLQGKYYEIALEYLQILTEKEPEKSTYWKLMGDVFCELKKFNLAIPNYKEAIAVNSEDFQEVEQDVYYGLGLCYQQLEEYSKAIKYYGKLLDKNENDPAALLNLSKIYGYHLEKYDKATHYAKKMVELYPQDGYGHHNLGLVYLYTNQFEKARWHLYMARKIVPEYTPVHEAIEELKDIEKN